MIADDPFTHEDFRDRLGKLLRLLSSDQEAEAEAARRKLVQHLAHYGVSFNDLTAHLSETHDGHPPVAPDALRHAAARAQRAEMAHRGAEEMNERLLGALAVARRQLRIAWTVAGTLGAAIGTAGLVVLALQLWPARDTPPARQIAPRMSDAVARPIPAPPPPASLAAAPALAPPDAAGARHPGEWIGTVLGQAELLDDPDSAAQRRALLDTGARVLVLQSGPTWLRVRTERGDGFMLKGLVRADR